MSRIYSACVIGGGAAGMTCADVLKMNDKNLSVCVIEQMPRVLKKVIVTGNGRCNITNRDISLSHYHGENPLFAAYALKNFDNFIVEVFFNKLGVIFHYDERGRAYPYSLQASSVVDALRLYAADNGVDIFTETEVYNIEKTKSGYLITTNKESFKAENIVIATGLLSGGDSLGSNGKMLSILKNMGYKTVKVTPSLVQIKTENTLTKSLKGIKITAKATLLSGDRAISQNTDEVLFCDYGLSGPAILYISREVERETGDTTVSLDLMPEYPHQKVYDMIRYRAGVLSNRKLEDLFLGMINKRVGQAVIKLAGLKLGDSVSTLTENDYKKLTSIIKDLRFKTLGTTGFNNSQVTAGGLDTAAFDDETMMSQTHEGLYAIGEILDIDGDCGGYNLQWAFSSAMCAAESIMDRLNEDENI